VEKSLRFLCVEIGHFSIFETHNSKVRDPLPFQDRKRYAPFTVKKLHFFSIPSWFLIISFYLCTPKSVFGLIIY
jgi:hypothetical protein